MFVVQVNLTIPNRYVANFQALLIDNVNNSLQEPGCNFFEIALQTSENETDFLLYEKYQCAADFDVHLATPHFNEFDKATSHMVTQKIVQTFHLLPTA